MMVQSSSDSLESKIVSSALWAAAGDALGWITELTSGPSSVKRRAGVDVVKEPVAWHRNIGGMTGARVLLPAGTYSDDTQLRLATSRSIRGDGEFDAETFAKVELTIWPAYALGGGRGTKAAAANLARRNVNWFSNFFEMKGSSYFSSGGNGACMRIQPHVWSSHPKEAREKVLLDVLRNSLITHGHPHGFLGGVFHALTVHDALFEDEILSPDHWGKYIDSFLDVVSFVREDPQLSTFWISAWESAAGCTLHEAIAVARDEAMRDVDEIEAILAKEGAASKVEVYRLILRSLKCTTPEYRGSGLKTSLAASALAWLFKSSNIEEPLTVAANELESDTDTIATMAGALLGAKHAQNLNWPLQDREFLSDDARRLAAIGRGIPSTSFRYPDLVDWRAPSSQTGVVQFFKRKMVVVGLGEAIPVSEEYKGTDAVWQWLQLPFGQTILAKRKKDIGGEVNANQLPKPFTLERPMRKLPETHHPTVSLVQSQLDLETGAVSESKMTADVKQTTAPQDPARETIDWWTEQVISAKFDDAVVGKYLNRCIDLTGSIEKTIAFASILAKAKIARGRRR